MYFKEVQKRKKERTFWGCTMLLCMSVCMQYLSLSCGRGLHKLHEKEWYIVLLKDFSFFLCISFEKYDVVLYSLGIYLVFILLPMHMIHY